MQVGTSGSFHQWFDPNKQQSTEATDSAAAPITEQQGADTGVQETREVKPLAPEITELPKRKVISETTKNDVVNLLSNNIPKHQQTLLGLNYMKELMENRMKNPQSVDVITPNLRMRLQKLTDSLPPGMQPPSPIYYSAREWESYIEKSLKALKMDYSESQDKGGHGGNFKARIVLPNGEVHQLFLKKQDEVEARNYRVLERIAPGLLEFSPQIYGSVMINGTKYLVMENTRLTAESESLEQLNDIKLAGKLRQRPEFNPIANQEEITITRGTKKGWLDERQMAKGAASSPDYMIAHENPLKRLFNYQYSRENLKSSLNSIPPEERRKLILEICRLQEALDNSPVALIGASIILIKQQDGSIRPILLDFAHIQVDINQQKTVNSILNPQEQGKIYYSNSIKNSSLQHYDDQRTSNLTSLTAIIRDITAIDIDRAARDRLDSTRSSDLSLSPLSSPSSRSPSPLSDRSFSIGSPDSANRTQSQSRANFVSKIFYSSSPYNH